MRKKIIAAIATLLVLTANACTNSNPVQTESTVAPDTTVSEPTTSAASKGVQKLTATELTKNEADFADRLIEVGLEDVSIDYSDEINLDNGKTGKAYLICDHNAFGGSSVFHPTYLAVETDTKYIFEELLPSYGEKIYLNDVDGDKTDEIIIDQATGGTALAHHCIIYKVENDTITRIFGPRLTTGFEGVTKDGFMFEVTNKFTGYNTTFELDNKCYIDWYFDEEGNVIKEGRMYLISFKEFYTIDKDADGVYEIYAEQSACLNSNTDNIGYTKCIIKYNPELKEFEVIDAEFISAYIMSDDYLVDSGEFYSAYKYDNAYMYKITAKDKTVRDIVNYSTKLPHFTMLTDNVLEIKGQSGTGQSTTWAYYYDAEADKLSKRYYHVLATDGELIAYYKRDNNDIGIIVQNIFDVTKYCKRFDEFLSPVSTDCTDPIQSVTFSEDGKSIEAVYLAGDKLIKTTEIFELY